ncbi:MAG: four helix bundle protein [Candidatus Peribacteraceae bacterium]|nr:four helix bundle protein [Candidatus Peribacteraceae bacterium]
MTQSSIPHFNLENRTLVFAKKIRAFVKLIPRTIANTEDGKQLIRSSGSIGANYIEANESLGKRDFMMKVKISKKEAKESGYWLQLLDMGDNKILENERMALFKESKELMLIFGAMLRNAQQKIL